jgi:hypothetical protein
MISTGEAKKIAETIKRAADDLNQVLLVAAERGVCTKITVREDWSVDYPYHYIDIDSISVDLNWVSPDEIQKLADEMEEDE